ncbi:myotubularin-related protein 13 [Lepeophtheirus salmonis]|uniref:Myotubularin-related protein 13 n=1 Tax=Lepeophtheirus salmonis TaxID=72036 RepID=A0A0K2T8U2_LEPSM|nr:myotubularin-related protein 13-like [Lepeophtheirus salmonis]
MSRLVDYFVVAGYDEDGCEEKKGFSCRGKILQRFPEKDWPDCGFTEGVELFCQPRGWRLSSLKEDPTFVVSVFTDVEGRRRFCGCLTFYEAVVWRKDGEDREESEVVFPSNSSSFVPGISVPALPADTLKFAPKCLVLISPHEYPDVFRNILGLIYTVHNECLTSPGGERIKIESLLGNLLGSVYVPHNHNQHQVRFSLSGLDKMSLQPPLYPEIPLTSNKVALLFKQLGIRSTLTLFCSAVTELKILFLSNSFSRLTDSCLALISLLYPLKYSHVFIPILPSALIEVLSTPTPFIIGLHASHRHEVLSDLLDVVVVDLDGGSVSIPENIHLQDIYEPLLSKVRHELSSVLNPDLGLADRAFVINGNTKHKHKPDTTLDKELRSVMLRLLVQLFAGYRSCLTLVRIHPKPYITFHKAAFLGMRNQTDSVFMKRIVDCMFFNAFVGERGTPWRRTDIFDELYAVFGEQLASEVKDPSKVLRNIQSLAEELWRNENPVTSSNQPYAQKIPQPAEGASTRIHQPVFPILDETLVDSLIKRGIEKQKLEELSASNNATVSVPPTAIMKLVPMGQHITEVLSPHSMLPNSARKLEVLRNCIISIFENRISDAKKTFPAVISALKSKQARIALCEELDFQKTGNQVTLEHPQFDMVVRLMNAALQDDSDMDEHGIAAKILPLSTVFGRRLTKGVIQYVYTLIQEHAVWQNQQFWEASFFNDVQRGIKSLYLSMRKDDRREVDFSPSSENGDINHSCPRELLSHRSRVEKEIRRSMVENPADRSVLELAAQEIRRWDLLDPAAQKELIMAEESTVYSQVFDYTNRMICLLCPLDGNLNHRHNRRSRYNEEFENHSNSITNSVAESDSIDAESGFEDQEISDIGQNVIKFVTRFADKVCSESNVTEEHIRAVNQMIPGTVAMHIETLENVATQAKHLPPIQKPKIHLPSLLPGEELLIENGLRVYLLPDGRDRSNNDLSLLPAGGALFLTKYRLIFKGSPIDPFAADKTVIRTFPVTSIMREKRFSFNEYLGEVDQQLKEGIQIKSNTFQIIRAGFDDEVTTEEVESFRRELQRLQYPEHIFHFFAFCSQYHVPISGSGIKKEKANQKYSTIRGFASKTLKNVSRAAGIKSTSTKRKASSKYLLPSVMPTMHGRLSLAEITNHDSRIEFDDSSTLGGAVGGAPLVIDESGASLPSSAATSPVVHHSIVNIPNNYKTLERLSERSYFKDWVRLGIIPSDYNISMNNKSNHHNSNTLNGRINNELHYDVSEFRVSTVNHRYTMCQSYPALLLVPAKISNDSLKRYSRCHKQGRLPTVTWRHPNTGALLLRGAGFHGRGVMGMFRRHQEGQGNSGNNYSQSGQSTSSSSNQAELTSSLEAEQYINSIIQLTPIKSLPISNWSGSELSVNSLALAAGNGNSTNRTTIDHYATLTPNMARKFNPITKAVDTLTRNTQAPKFGRMNMSNIKSSHRGSQNSLAVPTISSSQLPRNSIGTDSGADHVFLHKASLYIFGDKIKGVKVESHPRTEFIPLEFPDTRRIRASFKKLMRACIPSCPTDNSNDHQSFLKQVEASEWLNGLQTLLQISGAVVDLIDIQGASVMLCLEDGWDITAQISSIAQLCMDPYYRTIEGFRVLVEKEWLAFGHRFNHRSNLSNPNQDSGFTPLFLQFLDLVNQIRIQFPMAFEFNDFYLKFIAYHHVSCRFRTFLCDCEAHRYEAGLLDDRSFDDTPSIPPPPETLAQSADVSSDEEIYSGSSRMNPPPPTYESANLGVSIFDYIDRQHAKSPIFYNFSYSTSSELHQNILRPFSFISNLTIWDYFLGEELKHGPAYDMELYDQDLKFEEDDLFSDRISLASSIHTSMRKDVGSSLTFGYDALSQVHLDSYSQLLRDISHLENELGQLGGYHRWKYHLNRVDLPPVLPSPSDSPYDKRQGRLMHKRSTMELLLRGRVGSERSSSTSFQSGVHGASNSNGLPHRFEKHHYSTPTSCDWCNSLLWGLVRTGYRCSDCGYNCHEKCKDLVLKTCNKGSGSSSRVPRDITSDNFDQLLSGYGSAETSTSGKDMTAISSNIFNDQCGEEEPPRFSVFDSSSNADEHNSQIICQGYLYKQANFRIKGWKQRWFVLDSTKHQLRYYDTKDDFHSKGYIDLSEVKEVNEGSPQQNAPKKCVNFFDLHTHKRVFCFGAESKTAAKEWINKIQSCLQ